MIPEVCLTENERRLRELLQVRDEQLRTAHADNERIALQRDHLKRREADLIEACERVADGGQYRADIVSAIQRIRRERDDARAEIREALALLGGDAAAVGLVEAVKRAIEGGCGS